MHKDAYQHRSFFFFSSLPADDALHLEVLVVLLSAQALLRLLQPGLVLHQHLLGLFVLTLQTGLVLLQLLHRRPQLLLQHRDLLLVLSREAEREMRRSSSSPLSL